MSDARLADILRRARPPVLILSSRAGWGNHSAAQAVRESMPPGVRVRVESIESLANARDVREDFARHRWICAHAPGLLRVLHRFPFSYAAKLAKERRAPPRRDALELAVRAHERGTVIATNHRAALWAGTALVRLGREAPALWGVLTDYCLSAGWVFAGAERVARLLGPIDPSRVDRRYRGRYERIPFPVRACFSSLRGKSPDRDQTLLCGGGWGLGPIEKTLRSLAEVAPDLHVHVACGDNEPLRDRLERAYGGCARVSVYPRLPTLAPLVETCASVITRPGGVTISEVSAAGRQLFLLPGLPVIEEENARHATANLGAEFFSPKAFRRWRSTTASEAPPRPGGLS